MIADAPFRDRIKSLKRVKASSLIPNPANWRRHPAGQMDALRAVLSEIGFVGAELAIETPEGLMLIDGHARQELSGDQKIPVLVTDLTAEEADTILATFDPLGAMADVDATALASLLDSVTAESEGLQALLEQINRQHVPIPVLVAPPSEFAEVDENIDTAYKCPTCSFEWSGAPK